MVTIIGNALYNFIIKKSAIHLKEVKAGQATEIWIVLSRHITQKSDFANNKDFITLIVYK